ncbi:MAG: hypothetical protein JSV13_02425 [Nitrospiraceae bacterium]|jgi:hypothetical protein|nr:MAG: hypothetical protein JSV13_02425 [Nitrospiraceae bacterium]
MTNVTIHPGICGYVVRVSARKTNDKKVLVSIDTECETVRQMMNDITVLDMKEACTGYLQNPVYRSAARCLQHVACPVPSGILKALEVELELCLPEEVKITFTE